MVCHEREVDQCLYTVETHESEEKMSLSDMVVRLLQSAFYDKILMDARSALCSEGAEK